jgi:hypothetical protein
MEQTERIRQMEARLDRASAAVMDLSAALDRYEEVQEAIAILDQYYGSDEWKQDYADDEAGLLPPGLKRGVLSEDAVWNLLSDSRELKERLRNFA